MGLRSDSGVRAQLDTRAARCGRPGGVFPGVYNSRRKEGRARTGGAGMGRASAKRDPFRARVRVEMEKERAYSRPEPAET
jgi:hypothetical protein